MEYICYYYNTRIYVHAYIKHEYLTKERKNGSCKIILNLHSQGCIQNFLWGRGKFFLHRVLFLLSDVRTLVPGSLDYSESRENLLISNQIISNEHNYNFFSGRGYAQVGEGRSGRESPSAPPPPDTSLILLHEPFNTITILGTCALW